MISRIEGFILSPVGHAGLRLCSGQTPAGIQVCCQFCLETAWIPACAGMTEKKSRNIKGTGKFLADCFVGAGYVLFVERDASPHGLIEK
jgi:hypothetical protein